MRLPLLVAAVMLMTATAQAAYDQAWYTIDFWSGEYPNGFAVIKPDVSVPARAEMDKEAPASVSCALPYKAVFHPWNEARNRLSEARYVTASRIVPLKASKEFTFQPDEESDPVKIGKRQVIEYLIYGAEGYFTIRIDGKEYTASQELFESVEPVSDDAFLQEEWLELKCENGPKAWVYADDLRKTSDNGEMTYLDGLVAISAGGPGIDDYGAARDLTDAEAKAAN
jgi:hypothetical protein